MELSWSTFVLEIVNFLVLVWILKRFLYRPILDVIARRRSAIEEKLAEAHRLTEEARVLEAQYTGRLADWDAERQRARDSLAAELEKERARRLAELAAELETERHRTEAAAERRLAEQTSAAEQQALVQAAGFATRLLALAAGPELESRLVAMLIGELRSLPEDRRVVLREQWGEPPTAIDVATAFEPETALSEALEAVLRDVSGLDVPVRYRRDDALVAGAVVEIGAWVLSACVRDELKAFTELPHAAR